MSHIAAAPHHPAPAPRASVHIIGMPGPLPPGEHILWQGAPAWRALARRLCRVREVAIYLGIVVVGSGAFAVASGATLLEAGRAVLPVAAAGLAVLGFLFGLAWLVARSTEYTLTSHRLVMRLGIALPATLAIPHAGIAHAAVRLDCDGSGDLPIETKPGYAVAIHRVWPHARPGRLRRAHPMLRSIPAAGSVAALLARTLACAESERLRLARAPEPAVVTHSEQKALPELQPAD